MAINAFDHAISNPVRRTDDTIGLAIGMTISMTIRHTLLAILSLAQVGRDEKLDEQEEVRAEKSASENGSAFRPSTVFCFWEERILFVETMREELEGGVIYDGEVDHELGDLHSGHVLLPPETTAACCTIVIVI